MILVVILALQLLLRNKCNLPECSLWHQLELRILAYPLLEENKLSFLGGIILQLSVLYCNLQYYIQRNTSFIDSFLASVLILNPLKTTPENLIKADEVRRTNLADILTNILYHILEVKWIVYVEIFIWFCSTSCRE